MPVRPHTHRVLVVDDDTDVLEVVGAQLRESGFRVDLAHSAAEARDALEAQGTDLVISDVRMPGESGLQLLDHCRARFSQTPVLLLTAADEVALAVAAVKRGASDYLVKPVAQARLLSAVREALPEPQEGEELPLGRDRAFRAALGTLDLVAESDMAVLILGETGVGKELFAQRLHRKSRRHARPLITLNAAAIPASLLESELFGHERGAFSGATSARPGAIERAAGGTLFLDEVGELDPPVQAKLLRFLQEKTHRRVGGTKLWHDDVRVVAATHRDLEADVASKAFRPDLYFRLRGVAVTVPPLRERGDDVRLLGESLLEELADLQGKPRPRLESGAWRYLAAHSWPGNVRELRNLMERILIFGDRVVGEARVRSLLAKGPTKGTRVSGLAEQRRQHDADVIRDALRRAGGNKTACARALGISRRTLYYRLRDLQGLGVEEL